MKIALIRKDFLPSRGGGERYAVNLTEGLANLHHDVHVFAHTWEDPKHPEITFHKVETVTTYSPVKNLLFAYNCRRLLTKESFDIIYSLSQTYYQDAYRMGDGIHRHWLRIQNPKPAVRFFKLLTLRQQVILWLETKTFDPGNTSMIICNSHLGRRHASMYFNVPEERMCVIYNGVDHKTFHPGIRDEYNAKIRRELQIPSEAFTILFIARNFRRKGLDHLIRALPMVKNGKQCVRVLIAGRGDHTPYRRLASQIGCGDQLIFVGESESISRWYGVGDILVHPALYDPFSNVCLEALACGIPVITTRENGAAEIIKPEETGMVISDPSNREELASAISRFVPSHIRVTMQTKAAQSVRSFTIEENARQTLEIFSRILSMKRGLLLRKIDRERAREG